MKKQGHNCSSSKAMAGSCLVRPAKSDGTEYNKGYKILETCYDTRNIYERAIKHYYRRDFLYFASGGNWCRQATAAVVEATRTGDNKSGLECDVVRTRGIRAENMPNDIVLLYLLTYE